MRYLILALLLTGCGKSVTFVDPSAEQYYKDFYSVVGMKVPDFANTVVAVEPTRIVGAVGRCERWDQNNWRISLDPYVWGKFSDIRRRALVYHEMTHCVFGLDHTHYWKSYMNAHAPSNGAEDDMTIEALNAEVHEYIF